MSATARTWNNAVSLSTPDNSGQTSGRLSLFFKSVRGLNAPQQYIYLREAANENIIDVFLLAFHTRDCRGGKGERTIGRRALVWLFINYPDRFMKVFDKIPEYGRWDDIIELFPKVLCLSDITFVRTNYASTVPNSDHLKKLVLYQTEIVQKYTSQLREDIVNMNEGKSISMAAKWASSERDSMDRKYSTFKTLAKALGVKPRQLRKEYLVPLRSYLKVVETYMCAHKWETIDYSKVPSCAMKKLKKAFEKHDSERFITWKEQLSNVDTKVKVCGKQLYPHELVREIRISKGHADEVCEAQWKVLEDEIIKLGSLEDVLCVVDTSFSMHSPDYLPLDVAVSLGMLVSGAVNGIFKNHLFTFNSTPKLVLIKPGTISERWRQVSRISWGGSTNLQLTFDTILERGKENKLTDADMPKKLLIISDMQFNSINDYGNMITNFEEIDMKYKASGFTRPQIIFWNVNGSTTDFPVSSDDNGTALISGFSPSILKAIMNGKDLSPYTVMRDTLDSERLSPIRDALCNDTTVGIRVEESNEQ